MAMATGFYGKLPARGDFVRLGLPGSFIVPWDCWLQSVIPASRERLGADWLAAWLEAPVWCFALPAGACGPQPVLGVWLPSVDRASRYFPLALARIAPVPELLRDGAGFLAAAEQVGRAAIADDIPPEQVAKLLTTAAAEGAAALPAALGWADTPPVATWWTNGGPRRAPGSMVLPGLPDADSFVAMLDESAA